MLPADGLLVSGELNENSARKALGFPAIFFSRSEASQAAVRQYQTLSLIGHHEYRSGHTARASARKFRLETRKQAHEEKTRRGNGRVGTQEADVTQRGTSVHALHVSVLGRVGKQAAP